MDTAAGFSDQGVRELGVADLARVSDIDRALSGRARRHFFEKRLAVAARRPEDYVHLGIARGGALRGFVMAHVLRGEFGRAQAVGVLDALGVEPQSQERGIGQALLHELAAVLRRKGVDTLQSEAAWTDHDLMRFLDAAGFELASRFALERSATEPLAESIEEV